MTNETAVDRLRGQIEMADQADEIDATVLAAAVVEMADMLTDVSARVRKGNSLLGMLCGRIPMAPKKAKR